MFGDVKTINIYLHRQKGITFDIIHNYLNKTQ